MSRARFLVQALLFAVLTAAGVAVAVARGGVEPGALVALMALPPRVLALVAVLCAGLYLTDAWRYRVVGAAVGERVGWAAAAHASIGCNLFSCLTPGASLGAPAAMVYLARGGVPWESAGVVAVGKSMTGAAMLLLATFVLLGLGLGPPIPASARTLLAGGAWVVALVLGAMLLGGLFPAPAISLLAALRARLPAWADRPLDVLQGNIERLGALRRAALPLVGLAHLAYFACLVGVAAALAVGRGAVPGGAVATSVVYLGFTYVAPTPGGAGLAEGTATDFFGGLLAPGDAVLVVLAFRALAFYLYVAVGLVHLAWLGGLQEVLGAWGLTPRSSSPRPPGAPGP